jgi:hypothetical protein
MEPRRISEHLLRKGQTEPLIYMSQAILEIWNYWKCLGITSGTVSFRDLDRR